MRKFSLSFIVLAALALCVEAAEPDFQQVVQPFLAKHCVDCHGEDEPEGDRSLHDVRADFSDEAQVDTWQAMLEKLVLGEMPPEDEPRPDALALKRVRQWITSELKQANIEPEIEHKLRSPEFGNHVNHERLFDGSEQGPASSPPRLWRLSPFVYDQFVDGVGQNLRRAAAIHQPFPMDESKGMIADFAAGHFADAATLQLLMMNCRTIAQYQTTGIDRRGRRGRTRQMNNTPREFQEIIEAAGPPSTEQVKAAIGLEFQLLLERPPSTEEMNQLVAFSQRAIDAGGNVQGLQTTLMAILMKPEAVYRMEIGLGPEDEHGRRMLSPYELAFAIAYALTDKGPSDIEVKFPAEPGKQSPREQSPSEPPARSLLDLAHQGKLSTPAEIRRVVIQILDDNNMADADYTMFAQDHRIGNTRVLRFFRDFFGYHHAPKVFKDEKRIGLSDEFHTVRIVQDADQLVMHIFDEDKDVLRRLLTTDEYFVAYLGSLENINKDLNYIKTNVNDQNYRRNKAYVDRAEAAGRHAIPIEGPSIRRYVGFYNLDHETWDYPTKQPFPMPDRQRAGILMHPAWLIAWSGNFDNDPIRRGKWIREHLLADTIPDVPLTVNAVVPEDPHKTLRGRLVVTQEEYCWQCHEKMNPLGLPFERFDDFGRYRTSEMIGQLLTIFPRRHTGAETLPIDATGEIVDSGESGLDGKVDTAFDLVHKLAGSTRVRQSFVRHAFRFWMGRNETLDDSPTLMAADDAYVKGGGSMKAMIASLLSSDSFLYRKTR